MAAYDAASPRWAKVQDQVVNDLVAVPPVYVATWMESLRGVSDKLVEPLAVVFRDGKRRETERYLATDILAEYAAAHPKLMVELLLDSDATQYKVLFPKLDVYGEAGLAPLAAEIDKRLPAGAKDDDKDKLAKRQANAAVALLRMNQPAKVWPLLRHSPNPMVRSYLINQFGPMGADASALIQRLADEPDLTIRRALILSLGPDTFSEATWSTEEKKGLVEQLQKIYRTEADPGLHAAAEWLLRQWKLEAWLTRVNDEWAKDKDQREKRLDGIRQLLVKDQEKTPPQWYVNGQSQTMVVIPGPVEFLMGSPSTEAGRFPHEQLHRQRIGRSFAIAAKPVTVKEFLPGTARAAPEQFRSSVCCLDLRPAARCTLPGTTRPGTPSPAACSRSGDAVQRPR